MTPAPDGAGAFSGPASAESDSMTAMPQRPPVSKTLANRDKRSERNDFDLAVESALASIPQLNDEQVGRVVTLLTNAAKRNP